MNQVHFGVLELKSEASFLIFMFRKCFLTLILVMVIFGKVTIFGKFLFLKSLKTSSEDVMVYRSASQVSFELLFYYFITY